MTRPILLLEINEIPWRVLNHYRGRLPYVQRFFAQAKELTTRTVDAGELSPWVTWPSFHRGLSNRQHGVLNLGQDPKTFKGTPIWQEYRARGLTIGVFGSLQSWPPVDPGPGGFYILDTFAHDERCIPKAIEPLQRFNLDQVATSGRVVVGSPLRAALSPKFWIGLLRAGVTAKTIFRLAKQILHERLNPHVRARRPIFQTVLFWDVFRHLFNPTQPPAFTTLFTNHVAGVMHRYWNHLFPEDFPVELQPKERIHDQTMDFAMGVLDEMLKDVLQWQKQNPNLSVIFATSMGQAAEFRLEHHGAEAVVRDLTQLMKAIGLAPNQFQSLLAMVPQVAAQIADSSLRVRAKASLEGIRTHSGQSLFVVQELGESLSITLKNPTAQDCAKGTAKMADGSERSFSDLGITVLQTDAGTAYHIPEGIFAVTGPVRAEFDHLSEDQAIPADQVKALILTAAGLNIATDRHRPQSEENHVLQ